MRKGAKVGGELSIQATRYQRPYRCARGRTCVKDGAQTRSPVGFWPSPASGGSAGAPSPCPNPLCCAWCASMHRTCSSEHMNLRASALRVCAICVCSTQHGQRHCVSDANPKNIRLRPMTMETRCYKVFFPNYSKKKPAEDALVPPRWGTR